MPLSGLFSEPTYWFAGKIHPHALHLSVELEGMFAHLSAVARLFEPAEWRGGIEHIECVNPNDTRMDLLREAVGAHDVPRP